MKENLPHSIAYLPRLVMKAHFAWNLRKAFAGQTFSFISSNCLGGRFSEILATQYRSPTVGLYFDPADYLNFVGDLEKNLQADLECDEAASEAFGYPVGRVNGIQVKLQHYANFAQARNKWNARKSRVDIANAFFIFTDREGASYAQLEAFDQLPYPRKIMFVHQPYPELRSAIYIKGDESAGEVAELYSQWHRLNAALPLARLRRLISGAPARAHMRRMHMAGFDVCKPTADELARGLLARMRAGISSVLLFANTNFIVKCRSLVPQLQTAEVCVVNDGIGMDIAAALIHRERFPENLNGTDFTPYLLRYAHRPLRLFLLGGTPQVAARAADYVRQQLGQEVVGVCDGYAGRNETRLPERIVRSRPDILLVALGNPIQEQWILDHHQALKVPLVMGVGALFDFWAGAKPRAPRVVQSLRLEWLYRLCLEPGRLLRRYTVDFMRFLLYCYRYR